MKRAVCIAIDLMNNDKPPGSLAFLAGACEKANYEYNCISVNTLLNKKLESSRLDKLYDFVIKTNDVDTTNIGSDIDNIFEESSRELIKFNPDVIIVSVFSYVQFNLASLFLQKIRQINNSIEIIIGGPGIMETFPNGFTYGKELANRDLVDYYCLGEGDVVLVEFLKGNKVQLGLNQKDSKFESWVPQIDNLDKDYLMPSYKNIDTSVYKNLESKSSTIFTVSTSRGCVRSCNFCNVAVTWKKFRYRSGEHVANEILKHHLDVGAVHFTLVDSLINGSLKSFYNFNISMIDLKNQYPNLKDFSYNGMFIVRDKNSHKEELFKAMKEAGCESLQIGVETGSDRVRFEMNKKFTNADLDYHLEMCNKYGIRNSLLMFTGYPTETREDFEESLQLLERYQKYLINDTVIMVKHSGPFSMLKGTPIYEESHNMGIELNENYNSKSLDWFNSNNPSLTVKERILRDLEFRTKAVELRYPVPYAKQYITYLKQIDEQFLFDNFID